VQLFRYTIQTLFYIRDGCIAPALLGIDNEVSFRYTSEL
jgi:hypothetical protein